MGLIMAAMGRGDYDVAEARLKEAELTYAVETKGWFNPYWFLKENWQMIIGSSLEFPCSQCWLCSA